MENRIFIFSRIRYRQFLDFHRNMFKETNHRTGEIYKIKLMDDVSTYSKPTNAASMEDDVIIPKYNDLKIINGKVDLSYEALPFLFNLNGHDKNLLLFLLAYCINDDCTFIWNRLVFEHYSDAYLALTGSNRPTWNVVRQSVVALTKANVIQKKEPGIYMLNPLLYPTNHPNQDTKKKELIKAYGANGDNNRKAIIDSLFVEEKMMASNKA